MPQLKAGISGAELEDTSSCAKMWETTIAHSTADRRWIAWMCSVWHMVCTKFTCAVPCRYWTQIQWLVNLVGIECNAHYSQASFTLAGGQCHGCMHVTQCSSYLVNVLISGWVPQLNSKCMFQIFFLSGNSCHVGRNLESRLKNVQFVQNLPLIGCTSLKAWWKLVCMLTLLWWVLDCFKHNFNWAMHPSSFRATQTDAMPWPS